MQFANCFDMGIVSGKGCMFDPGSPKSLGY